MNNFYSDDSSKRARLRIEQMNQMAEELTQALGLPQEVKYDVLSALASHTLPAPLTQRREWSSSLSQTDSEVYPLPLIVDTPLVQVSKQKEKFMRQDVSKKLPEVPSFAPLMGAKKWPPSLRPSWLVLWAIVVVSILAIILWRSPLGMTWFSPASGVSSVRPVEPWRLQPDQTFVQNADGLFSIKWVTMSSKEFHFFYAYQSSSQGTLSVDAFSICSPCHRDKIQLQTSVQSLGQIGHFRVGVVHVSRISEAGQTLSLQITLPGNKTAPSDLDILHQIARELPPHNGIYPGGFSIYAGQSDTPLIAFSTPVMQEQVAYFRSTLPVQTGTSHIFVRLDDPVVISIISKQEYLAIAGVQNYQP